MSATRAFLEARDQLLSCREDLAEALRRFRWPQLTGFNWARDYFDVVAAGSEAPALRVVDDGGGDETLSFSALARRSKQVAAFLGTAGENFVIDTDHWRHFWMMLGAMWAMFAAAQPYKVRADTASPTDF